jgi:tRNA uridine 5-carboxymethylaminomethyl modification enzyme
MHIVVVGGGHAGIEAANIAARMGIKTTLLTINLDQIGQMSCNPSIGGVGKGHIVRELDAIGGVMGRLADTAGIHFRVLNASRGIAVRGPRAQVDRIKYRAAARNYLENIDNLTLRQGMATSISWQNDTKELRGINLLDGSFIKCEAIILAAGTFLNGKILIGEQIFDAGRAGEPSSTNLAQQLRAIGLRTNRLKTGTSPRINARSIDFSKMEPQQTDPIPHNFSFFSKSTRLQQVCCHVVHTTAETEQIVRDNLHRSSTYGGHISTVGPRYCPSIEDKFVKFHQKQNHQIFVEPESLENNEVYLSGLSTSMPPDIQLHMVRSLPGFERAEIIRPGYAIEYDSFDPLQLRQDLSIDGLDGVWFAGQINGTTGYEEAAGQGIMAGINASRYLLGQEAIVLGRHQAYIGVMIDDLVTKGIDEPYRMLTARAEHRLGLACDLADVRLLEVAKEIGALTSLEISRTESVKAYRSNIREQCIKTWVTKTSPLGKIVLDDNLNLDSGISVADLFRRQQITKSTVDMILYSLPGWDNNSFNHAWERDLLLFELRYQKFQTREAYLLEGHKAWDNIRIPASFNIDHLPGFSNEVKEKIQHHRPETLGQASRIPGITPTAITLMHMFIERAQAK